jgi:hypothetical protein
VTTETSAWPRKELLMVIDVHCHIWEKHLVQEGLKGLLDSVAEELRVQDPESLWNGSIERLIEGMDEAGIDRQEARTGLSGKMERERK